MRLRTPEKALVKFLKRFTFFATLTLFTLTPTLIFAQCGCQRWDVKTASDPAAKDIKAGVSPVPNLVGRSGGSRSTRSDAELQIYGGEATLLEYKMEPDGDYHLLLDFGGGATLVAEIPDPSCVALASPFYSDISATRKTFDDAFAVTTRFKKANAKVRISGVGFIDKPHGVRGASTTAELHPVIFIQIEDVSQPENQTEDGDGDDDDDDCGFSYILQPLLRIISFAMHG